MLGKTTNEYCSYLFAPWHCSRTKIIKHPLTLQVAANALSYGMGQLGEFIAGMCFDPVKPHPVPGVHEPGAVWIASTRRPEGVCITVAVGWN